MEDAIRLNATAVAFSILVGAEFERDTLLAFTKVVDEAERYGIPTLAVTAVGKALVRDAKYLSLASRMAAELGARIVKTYYCENFERVINTCPVPVVIAGGKKIPEHDALTLAYNAIRSGAAGVDMGRNIFQSEAPVAMIRTVRAIVHIGLADVLTYSVHTETFWLGPEGRGEQVEAVADTVTPDYDFAIIAGDFNTVTPTSITGIEQRMAAHDLVRLSKGAGYTVKMGQLHFTLDHIFGSDVPVLDKGVYRETTASDHYPLWVTLAAKAETE